MARYGPETSELVVAHGWSRSLAAAGPWQGLHVHALHLIDEIRAHGIDDPCWTFGGGTVPMLGCRHRRSKDIDIFVPDPQYLGNGSPRLGEVPEARVPSCFLSWGVQPR